MIAGEGLTKYVFMLSVNWNIELITLGINYELLKDSYLGRRSLWCWNEEMHDTLVGFILFYLNQ